LRRGPVSRGILGGPDAQLLKMLQGILVRGFTRP
jgi:hypothetical protein